MKYREFQNVHENTTFFTFKTLGKSFYKNQGLEGKVGTMIGQSTKHQSEVLPEEFLCPSKYIGV